MITTFFNLLTIISFSEKKKKGVRFQESLPRARSHSSSHKSRRSSGSNSAHQSGSSKKIRDKPHGKRINRNRHHGSPSKESPSTSSAPPQPQPQPSPGVKKPYFVCDDSDSISVCSTCSSSSSSSEDRLYELPQRKHYGGVRVSYVPNDALACVKKTRTPKKYIGGAVGNVSNDALLGLDDMREYKNCIIS